MALTRPRAAQIYDIDYKQATRVVTVANITLGGGAPNQVDGVNLSLKDRVLVTGQSTASQNGIYYVTTLGTGSNGTWTRSADTDATGELLSGTVVMVTEGLIYADTQWKLTTDDPITIGSTALTFVQNYSANSIASGNSNVVVLTNANVLISSAGTANVVDVFGTGITITGTESVTGNVTVGNLLTTGLISATGNVTGDYFLGNVFYANGITASKIYSGNSEVNVTAAGGNVNVSIGGTSNVAVFSTAGEYITGLLSVTGNTTAGNVLTGGVISATGNATAGNILTGGVISATSTVTGSSLLGGVVSASGNVTGGNILTGGLISATSNITGGNLSGTLVTGTLVTAAQPNVTSVGTLSSLNSGTISSSGNVTGANILTGGLVSATGNVTGDYILGNVFYANGITASKIYSGNSEVNVTSSGGNVNVSIGGTSNVAVFTTAGEFVTGLISASGNVTGGNVLTGGLISATSNVIAGNVRTAGLISATGAVTAASVVGGVITGSSTSVTGTTTAASVVGGVITGSSVSVTGNVSGVNHFGTNTSVTGTTTAASVVGGVITGSSTSVTANVTGGNVLTGGVISAAGNITGNYLLGNASQVTGVNTFNQIFVTGATTVNAASLTSNVTFAGGSNIELTSDGATITIAYSAVASSSIFATGGDMGLIADPVTASEDLGTVIVVADTSYDLGDLFTTVTYNQIDMTGFTSNINTGNLNAVGLVSAVGNVTGNYIYGNGSQLTGIAGGTSVINGTSNIVVGSSANITLAVAGTSNVVIFTTTGMSATGNITGNYFVGNGAALTGITSTPPPLNINLQQNYGGF